jgi:hypothetical protein
MFLMEILNKGVIHPGLSLPSALLTRSRVGGNDDPHYGAGSPMAGSR